MQRIKNMTVTCFIILTVISILSRFPEQAKEKVAYTFLSLPRTGYNLLKKARSPASKFGGSGL
jgi:hypothetical protein